MQKKKKKSLNLHNLTIYNFKKIIENPYPFCPPILFDLYVYVHFAASMPRVPHKMRSVQA
jgi:hypothetical protein